MDINTLKQITQAFDYLFDSMVVTDLNGIITDWNKGSENLYGYSKEEAVGQPVNILHLPEDSEHITSEVISAVERFGKWTGEVRMLHKNGQAGWVESMCVPIFDSNELIIGALGVNRDITARKNETKHLEYLAHYDYLTNIPNRNLLFNRVEHLIAKSKSDMNSFALLFIDLNRFKTINDTKGHAFGDQVLIETSLRLKQSIPHTDTVARIGGDEFVVLLENITHKSNVSSIARIITNAMSYPFIINDERIEISCSVGASIYPHEGTTTYDLMAAADKAMYNTKHKKEVSL
jgi:diguanylate cyclase (GGDEF)-like protein/PAS domain S-box-containing protein